MSEMVSEAQATPDETQAKKPKAKSRAKKVATSAAVGSPLSVKPLLAEPLLVEPLILPKRKAGRPPGRGMKIGADPIRGSMRDAAADPMRCRATTEDWLGGNIEQCALDKNHECPHVTETGRDWVDLTIDLDPTRCKAWRWRKDGGIEQCALDVGHYRDSFSSKPCAHCTEEGEEWFRR